MTETKDENSQMLYTVSGVSRQTMLKEFYKVAARNQHEAWLKVSTVADNVVVDIAEPILEK